MNTITILDIKKIMSLYGVLIFFALFCIVITIIEPRFFTIHNLLNVFRQTSVNAIIAAGMTLVILTGGIDLSVGSIFALSSVVGALAIIKGFGAIPAVFITLILGAMMGMLNAFFVVTFKMQAFIATLVTMTFARGLTYIVTDGIPATISATAKGSNIFYFIGDGYFLGIPFPVILTIVLYTFLFWILHKTRYGRYLYAVGGNEKAALTAGIKVSN
ncbi:MAG: ABC transporter permease, partial [Brevinema sp.]